MTKFLIGLSIPLWLMTFAFLYWPMMDYENKPGELAQTTIDFPMRSRLKTDIDKNTIVVFFHPQCPCSQATLAELEVLMTRYGKKATTYALFLKPEGVSDQWVKTSLFKDASAIEGVTTIIDDNGTEARLFGSKTSGQLLVYDRTRHLVYSGGITEKRGHIGDNDGLDTALASLSCKQSNVGSKTVYGCPLFSNQGARKLQ
jgi:hypothetical protein